MTAIRRRALLPLTLVLAAATPHATHAAAAAARPVWAHKTIRLSAAYERWLLDRIEAGEAISAETIHRFGLDLPIDDPTFAHAQPDATTQPPHITGATNLASDVRINNKTLDATCPACSNRPLGQAETTIAVLGLNQVAGWNNTRGFCTGGAIQGYGWSADGGKTWTDAGDPPALATGGRYRGDPVVAVNSATARFYILGLYEGGALGSGLALCWGHFAAGTFVLDGNRQIAVGGADFLDKEWMAVDPISGLVYVSWTNFPSTGGDYIAFQAFDADGNALTGQQTLSSPAGFGQVQGSRPVVGPDGEMYVMWYEYGYPKSHHRIRRSDDLGFTFGPEQTIADFFENGYSGAPGYRRAFAPTFASVAVDHSSGAHRGRVYATWDEAVNFYDTTFNLGTPKSEVESNDFYASATPFAVGDVIRGTIASTAELDLWRFSGLKGQTLYFAADSTADNTTLTMRLVCLSDTSSLDNARLLALNSARYPALCFSLPADGDYILRLNGGGPVPSNYRILTAFDTPSLDDRATDHRDQMVAYSDDGATWSTPARISDSDPGFDGIFAEVAVDGNGRVYSYWHDFRRDAACGAESFEYMVASGDGGVTWGPNQALSDDRSFWSFAACGSANQGDYQGITAAGNAVYPCWADSRLGDPDVFTEATRFDFDVSCATTILRPVGPDTTLSFVILNTGNTTETFAWRIVATGMTMTAGATSGSELIGVGGSATIVATFANWFCGPTPTLEFGAYDTFIPGYDKTCSAYVSCNFTTGVGDAPVAFELGRPQPNPSTGRVGLDFALPRAAAARLAIYGADGRRIRSLAEGQLAAGRHEREWDGRDEAGHLMPPGVYYARLVAEGRELRRVITRLR